MLTVVLAPSKLRYDSGRSLSRTRTIQASLTAFFSVFLACLLFIGVQFVAVFWSAHNMVYASEQSFVYIPPVTQPTESAVSKSEVDPAQIQAVVDAWAIKYQQNKNAIGKR